MAEWRNSVRVEAPVFRNVQKGTDAALLPRVALTSAAAEAALTAIYSATGGEDWLNSKNGLSGELPGHWAGSQPWCKRISAATGRPGLL